MMKSNLVLLDRYD